MARGAGNQQAVIRWLATQLRLLQRRLEELEKLQPHKPQPYVPDPLSFALVDGDPRERPQPKVRPAALRGVELVEEREELLEEPGKEEAAEKFESSQVELERLVRCIAEPWTPCNDGFQWNASAPDFVPERSLEPLQPKFNDPELLQAVNAEAIDLGLVVGPVSHLTPEQQEFDEQFEYEEYLESEFGMIEGPGSAKAVAEAEELKNRGNDLYKKRKFEEALQMYNLAIEKDPDKVVYSYNKCGVWIEMGRPQYLAEAVETGLSLLTRAGDMTSKVQQRLATAIARLAVWNNSRQCFKAWEEQTFGGDGSESLCSSKGWPSDHSFGD